MGGAFGFSEALMEHIRYALARGLAKIPRRRKVHLAPLEPDSFLVWAWNKGDRRRGTRPLSLEDIWFERSRREPEITLEYLRHEYVHLAASVRRNQRLGLDPWEGIL